MELITFLLSSDIVGILFDILLFLFVWFVGGRETARKFIKSKRKLKQKQTKVVEKEAKKLEENLELLKELEK